MENKENIEDLNSNGPTIPEEADKSFKTLFIDSENESRKTNNDINNILSRNFDLVSLKNELREKYGKDFFEYTYINNLIGLINSVDCLEDKKVLLTEIDSLPIVDSVYKFDESNYMILTKDNKKIKFTTISSFLKDNLDEIDGNEYLEYFIDTVDYIEKREQKCHDLSIYLSAILENYLKISNNLVTGNPSYYVDKNKYLHSWVEFKDKENDNEPKVMDATQNLIMDKDSYYLLKNIKKEEIVSIISSKDIVSDSKKYSSIINKIDLKTYLTSRDEIIENIKKVENKLENKTSHDKKSQDKTNDDGEER
ncbi:MAG: hypothetical protein J6N78_03060 [Clostridia bacterium]|nr:hypothetical protein [Clostridia bacterium]